MTRSALSILVLRLLGAALTYAFVVAMSRMTTVADFGILGTVMSASQFISVAGSFGQQLALIRFVPPLLARDEPRAAHDIVARGAKLTVMINGLLWLAIATALLVAGALGWVARAPLIAFGLLMMPLTAVIDLQASLARSYKLILLAIVPKDVLWRIISLLLIVAVLLLLHTGRLPLWIGFAIMVATLAGLIVAAQLIGQTRHGLPSIAQLRAPLADPEAVAQWRAAKVPLWLVSVSSTALGNIDVIITAILLGPEPAGIYFAANRIAFAPIYFQQSYNIVIGPILSEHHARGNPGAAEQAARSAAVQIFVPTVLASAVLAAAAPLVLGLFGHEFVAGVPVLYLLIAATVANTAFGPVDMVLNMCSEERLSMHIGVAMLVLAAALIAILGYIGGAVGVAIGVLVSIIARRWLQWLAVERKVGMRIDVVSAALRLPALPRRELRQ